MDSALPRIEQELSKSPPRRWFITGVAGFIGSNLLEALLRLGQAVSGLDNLSTGRRQNLDDVEQQVGREAFRRFEFVEGDILDAGLCRKLCAEADLVLHQAALGSVPRSVEDPWQSHQANVDGFINVALACRDARKRLVYASSSSVYGDSPHSPKREDQLGQPLSPYAVTKRADELYGRVFAELYGLELIGLRYFNVFGPRQSPNGPYAAVIPRWIEARLRDQVCHLFGDGLASRDFCFVSNVVQANLLSAMAAPKALNRVYNIALGQETRLLDLYRMIDDLSPAPKGAAGLAHQPPRPGDVRQSLADITQARELLGYHPAVEIKEGLRRTVEWFKKQPVSG